MYTYKIIFYRTSLYLLMLLYVVLPICLWGQVQERLSSDMPPQWGLLDRSIVDMFDYILFIEARNSNLDGAPLRRVLDSVFQEVGRITTDKESEEYSSYDVFDSLNYILASMMYSLTVNFTTEQDRADYRIYRAPVMALRYPPCDFKPIPPDTTIKRPAHLEKIAEQIKNLPLKRLPRSYNEYILTHDIFFLPMPAIAITHGARKLPQIRRE